MKFRNANECDDSFEFKVKKKRNTKKTEKDKRVRWLWPGPLSCCDGRGRWGSTQCHLKPRTTLCKASIFFSRKPSCHCPTKRGATFHKARIIISWTFVSLSRVVLSYSSGLMTPRTMDNEAAQSWNFTLMYQCTIFACHQCLPLEGRNIRCPERNSASWTDI